MPHLVNSEIPRKNQNKVGSEFSSLDTKIRFFNWEEEQLINPVFGSLSVAQKLWDPPGDTHCKTDWAVPEAL